MKTLIPLLDKFLTAPIVKSAASPVVFWFCLSLTFAAICSLLGLQQAFGSEYVVQNDAVQHVFWTQRFVDAELFPGDLIADYYQSSAPPGYAAFYRLMASVGLHPLFISKILPPVLCLVSTVYCFGVCLEMLPVPATGFIATLLLNQNLWLKDDLASATPRAFLYPLLLAFLYYLLRRSLLPCLVTIALQGLFYPQTVFICAGILILQVFRWERGWPRLSQNRRDYWFCFACLGVAFLVMLPYVLNSSEFGPVVTEAQARAMPEFSLHGRSRFFLKDPWEFWFHKQRSGIFPEEWFKLQYSYFPLMFLIGLSLPMLLRYPSRFPLAGKVKSGIVLLPQLALVSLTLFFAAHAVLFKLYLPSRYTQHSFRIIMALTAGITLILMLDAVWHWAEQTSQKATLPGKPMAMASKRQKQKKNISFVLLLFTCAWFAALVFLYPSVVKQFPKVNYEVGEVPQLYKFFQAQPKDILIASLVKDVNYLPTFSQRSILVGREHSIPYHIGYYTQIRQRTNDLIKAQYSTDIKEVHSFIQKYGVDFWILDRAAFTPGYLTEDLKDRNRIWIRQYQSTAEALAKLEQGTVPALASVTERCSVFATESLVVLQAECIAKPYKTHP